MEKKDRKTITFILDMILYNDYKKYCDENGMKISKRIELLLRKDLEKINKEREKHA